MSNILFSHRPQLGVSVGVTEHNGQLYLAAAFTNDGSSRNGVTHEDRIDTFSREMSRKIISGRIAQAIAGTQSQFGIVLSTKLSAKEFIYLFRELFKPDPYEGDATFHDELTLEGVGQLRARMRVSNIWNKIVLMANAIANHSLSDRLAQTIAERPEILDEIRAALEEPVVE